MKICLNFFILFFNKGIIAKLIFSTIYWLPGMAGESLASWLHHGLIYLPPFPQHVSSWFSLNHNVCIIMTMQIVFTAEPLLAVPPPCTPFILFLKYNWNLGTSALLQDNPIPLSSQHGLTWPYVVSRLVSLLSKKWFCTEQSSNMTEKDD